MGDYGDIRGLLSGLMGSDPAEDAAGGGQGYVRTGRGSWTVITLRRALRVRRS